MIVPIISLLPRRFRGVYASFFMTAHRTDAEVAFLTVLLVRTIGMALAFRIAAVQAGLRVGIPGVRPLSILSISVKIGSGLFAADGAVDVMF